MIIGSERCVSSLKASEQIPLDFWNHVGVYSNNYLLQFKHFCKDNSLEVIQVIRDIPREGGDKVSRLLFYAY
jgi:hypothetical protein